MLNRAGGTALCIAPFPFSLAREEALKPEECTACLTVEGVLEILQLRGMRCGGGKVRCFVEQLDYGNEQRV